MTPLVITPAPRPVPAVVELLEHLLAKAREGELRQLAVATRAVGSQVGTAMVGEEEDVFRMLGALRFLEQRAMDMIER